MPTMPDPKMKSKRPPAKARSAKSTSKIEYRTVESWDQIPRDKWNKWFIRLYEHCRAKPGAREDHPWGEVVFKVGDKGKVFAFLGIPDRARVCAKATEDDFDNWLSLEYVKLAPYIGRFGWVLISVNNAKSLKLALEAINQSYIQIAPKPKRAAGANCKA